MKKTILSFLFLGAVLSAAPVNVTLLNTGNNMVDSSGQFYVGPYTLTLNGTATPAMCMNDNIDNNVGDSWTANKTAVTSSDLGNTYLGNAGTRTIEGYTFSSAQIYNAEAYLFSQIVKPGADQADIQEAAWFIMDPTNTTYANNAGVQNYLLDAYNNSPSFDASYYSIVSNVDGAGQPGTTQEFLVASAPEPASFALFGGGLIAVGAARMFRRKRVNPERAVLAS